MTDARGAKRSGRSHTVKRVRSKLASLRYGSKSHTARLILVTGEYGKTTVVRLIAELLQESGHKVVEMVAAEGAGHSIETDPFLLHRRLANASRQGYDYVVLEVHAALIASQVVPTLSVEMVVATTDSPELSILAALPVKYLVIPYGVAPPAGVAHQNIMTVGTDETADMRVVATQLYRKGTEVSLVIDMHTELEVASYLVGQANASNIATALAAVYVLGVDIATFAEGVARLAHVPGNFEYIAHPAPYLVAVDRGGPASTLPLLFESAKQLAKRRLLVALDAAVEPSILEELRGHADRIVMVGESSEPDVARDHEEAAFITVRGAKKDDLVLLIGHRYAVYDDDGTLVIAKTIGGSHE
jgi:UDP-N-acetylmuramyl tripeptide synthase